MTNAQTETEGLSGSEVKDLLESLKMFKKWILSRGIVPVLPEIKGTYDLPFANEDWMMKVNTGNRKVSFNTFVRQKCSFDYFRSIVLHEFFHLVVQKVPTKDDATKIKDDFGDQLMKLIDIEADFFTALFYKEKHNYDLVRYLRLYYEGSSVFSDKWIRIAKLERYIGTLLSISKLFIDNAGKRKCQSCDLYLPSISPLNTEESLHVLVVTKEHIHFDQINVNQKDFVEMKACYTNIDTLTYKGYVEKIVKFVCKAFSIDQPKHITQAIKNIK